MLNKTIIGILMISVLVASAGTVFAGWQENSVNGIGQENCLNDLSEQVTDEQMEDFLAFMNEERIEVRETVRELKRSGSSVEEMTAVIESFQQEVRNKLVELGIYPTEFPIMPMKNMGAAGGGKGNGQGLRKGNGQGFHYNQ